MDERNTTDRAARVVFAGALLASAILLLYYRLKVGFLADDLVFLRERAIGGIDTLLEPHNENIVVLQVVIYRAFWSVFGIASSVPLQVISLVVFLASIVVFFGWMRDRVGEWAATIASIPVLFMGTAYHDLLWAFQIGYSLSIAAGLVALIALDRGGRHANLIACVALVVAVLTSSLGLPFLVASAVLLICRDGRDFLRSYVLWVPGLMFLAWYIGWGSTAESFFSFENLLDSPAYVAESVKSVIMGLTGLHRLSSPAGDILGWVIAVLVTGFTAASLIRRKTLPAPFLIALAAGLTFWLMASINQIEGIEVRSPDQSRYQYPGAIFVLMMLAGAFAGMRPGRKLLSAFAVLAVISVVCSLGVFSRGWKELEAGAVPAKAAMTAVDIAGENANPEFRIPLVPYFAEDDMSVAYYRELVDRYGKAGWSSEQIEDLSESERETLDGYLEQVLER